MIIHESYNPDKIEKFVQKYWNENQTFSVKENNDKKKFYCLSMMPYPSGNLHIGHIRNYTIGDVISRFQRMLGKNVLQPISWDAFGLPAEQAAITHNIDPTNWTTCNINDMKNQLKSLGFAYDWNREFATCQPEYYRWEQWFFTVLYKKGLVYKKHASVNWCSYHKTVLANEQVINNCCWRCNNPIKNKKISQWFIKITKYAEELVFGLNKLKYWPSQVKTMQRNWIGRSKGLNVIFKIINKKDIITAYITRLDTFMGITYLTISMDHPISLQEAKNNSKINDFIQKNNNIHKQLNINECAITRKKTGIFTNIYAIHPISKDALPIWIVNFHSSIKKITDDINAIAAVPAHNQQDWEFANNYNLPIKSVIKSLNEDKNNNVLIQPFCGIGVLFNSGEFNGLYSHAASDAISKLLIKKELAQHKIYYQLKDWGVSRQRYWGVPIPMVTLLNGTIKPVPNNQLPVILPEKNNTKENTLKDYSDWINTTYKNQIAFRDIDTFDTFMESSWYYARCTCPNYQKGMLDTRATRYWLPVDQYIGGIEHATMHLMYFRFYHKLMRDEGLVFSDEPAIRLLCQGMVLADSFYYLSNAGQRIWVSPTAVKTIKKNKSGKIIKAIDINGHNLIYDGLCKMSKSKNNGINPKTILKKYGADSIRFFIMFAAPVEATLKWKESGIIGAQRFLKHVWDLVYKHIQYGPIHKICFSKLNKNQKKIRYHTYKTVEKVTNDINQTQSFNTALSAIMILVNKLLYFVASSKKNIQDRAIIQESLLIIIRLLYPFTPHISFVLWKALGNSNNIDDAMWPVVDIKAIKNKEVLIIVQINGKKRHKIYAQLNSDKNTICNILKTENTINKYFFNKKISKIIYVPNKIINFVIT